MDTIDVLTAETLEEAAGAPRAEGDRLLARFAIRSIPTLVVLRDGQLVAAEAGVIGAAQLVDALDSIAGQTPDAVGAQ